LALSVLAIAAWAWCALAVAAAESGTLRLANGQLQIGLDASNATLRELTGTPGGDQLLGGTEPFALWQITARSGNTVQEFSAERAGPVRVEHLAGSALRLVWDNVAPTGAAPVRVTVEIHLGQPTPSLSRWELSVSKPADMRIKEVHFPRVPGLKPRADETLALPLAMGQMLTGPRKLLAGRDGKGARLAWSYPHRLSLSCLALYQPDGPGFYAACDDARAYAKIFALWGDRQKQVHFEIVDRPEQEAVGLAEYKIPYAVVLGTFCGDWSTAAAIYRDSPAARCWAEKGRLRRGMVPDWVCQTGLWVWNRGRSEGVLPPAAVMARHAKVPVSVFWHWWHDCPYDAGFPDYLPPREGVASFKKAVEVAHREGLHVTPYMNQRLWGLNAPSWAREGAEAYAVKGPNGKIKPESYNVFMKAPCVPMCLGTEFWRNKYATIAREVVCDLGADGIYMDQACIGTDCYDPLHGHIVGSGRYWGECFGLLNLAIRDRCAAVKRVVLSGEHCGEAWLPYLDMMLNLSVSEERTGGGKRPWAVIPFFPAVYHASVITYGNYGALVHPPYDERWPAEKAPATRLTLVDRKFSDQFCLEQARSFVWGIQPMIPNFLPNQLQERSTEIDYLTRMVRTRMQALKYLLHGTWLRPPALDVPEREIDLAKIGTYIALSESKGRYPVVLAGAWRAADGDVAIALASIADETLHLRLPIDRKAYGLPDACEVYRIDDRGRQRLGALAVGQATVDVELPPRTAWVIELRAAPKAGLTLTEQGRSAYRIVTAAQAPPSTHYAAEELQRFLGKISGVKLPIVTDATPAQDREILVGRSTRLDLLDAKIDLASLGREGYVLRTAGSRLAIVGGEPRGTLYGVYGLLEDHLGCRWFTPQIERIPRRATLTLPALAERKTPTFEYRETYTWESYDGDWMARNRLNGAGGRGRLLERQGIRPPVPELGVKHGGSIRFGFGFFVHTLEKIIPAKQYYAEHPEYFALWKGRRDPVQMCCTNEDVIRLCTEGILKGMREQPEATVFSLSQNDNMVYCQCEQCKAIAQREETPMGPLLHLVNRVAEVTERQFPEKIVETLAYVWSRRPPKTMRPRPNVVIRLCDIECCFAHSLASACTERNAAFVADLEAWSKRCDRLWIWDYTTNYAHYLLPLPNKRVLDDNIRLFAANRAAGVFEQGTYDTPDSEMVELKAYLIAKFLWNPQYDAERATREFLAAYFGPAAEPIRAYLDRTHDFSEREGVHVGIYVRPTHAHLPPSLLAESDRRWTQAETLAAGDTAVLDRVRRSRMSVDYAIVEQGRAAAKVPAEKRTPEQLGVLALARQRFAPFMNTMAASPITRIREWKNMDKAEYRNRLATDLGIE
jgi:hypothetical protein